MPNSRAVRIAAFALLAWPGFALAQTEPLITDRPDFTESPFAVPPRSIQVEAGVTWQPDGQSSTTSGPEALIRWSPARRFEVRLEPPGYVHAASLRGYTDAGLGVKVEVGRFAGWSIGTIAFVGLPTGDDEASAGRVVPEVIVAAARDLGDAWSIGTQASAGRPDAGAGVVLASTLVMGRALIPSLGAFVEVAAERVPGAAVSAALHAGLAFLVSPTLQLDVHASRGVSGRGGDDAVGLGVSTRFD